MKLYAFILDFPNLPLVQGLILLLLISGGTSMPRGDDDLDVLLTRVLKSVSWRPKGEG